jgi:hypothetical protein
MVSRDFAIGEVGKSMNIKGLATHAAFGGRLDALHFDAG